jgi:hypothetical protein
VNATDDVAKLRSVWLAALAISRETSNDDDDEAEQKAWDALVDYVDANGLERTPDDPRFGSW